jgi:translation initiation factor 2 subunit 2
MDEHDIIDGEGLGEDLPPVGAADEPVEDDEDVVNFTMQLKKRRKKKKKKKDKENADPEAATTKTQEPDDPWIGSDRDYTYTELLNRVFDILHEHNPGISSRKKHSMPPPQINRAGTRKTMWANFAADCKAMHRSQDHFKAFLLTELGTDGNLDGQNRLILKGRYQAGKHIEPLLRKYIREYVQCQMCQNPQTTLTRDNVTRLYFVQCDICNARRAVATLKSGFRAQSRAERRAARA